jgi:CO dehydrogenase nickel-insertion accessory protein CooC1
VRGITTAGRVVNVLDELQTRVGRSRLVVNRVEPGGLPQELRDAIAANGLVLTAELPADADLARLDAVGRSLVDLPEGDPVVAGVGAIVAEILSVHKEAVGADHR